MNRTNCQECGKLTKTLHMRKGMFLCWGCYRKTIHIINYSGGIKTNTQTIEKALNKTYEVKGYLTKNGTIQSSCSFPSILIGHKFKVTLIDVKSQKGDKTKKDK